MKRFSAQIGITSLFLCVPLVSGVSAQAKDDQLKPREPLVTRAPKVGTWVVNYKYKPEKSQAIKPTQPGATAKDPERITSILTEKNGEVYHQITTYSSGAKKEAWNVAGEQICKNANSTTYIHVAEGNPLYNDFSKTDFDELSWISMENYVGVEGSGNKAFVFEVKNANRPATAAEKDERSTLMKVFEETAGAKGGPAAQRNKAAKQDFDSYLQQRFGDTKSHATLEVTSQLPLIYDDGEVVREYDFSDKPGPSAAATEAMQELQSWRNHTKRNAVHAAPP